MTVTLEQIRAAVAEEYELSIEQFASYRLGVPYVEARRVYAALAWKYTSHTPKQIGPLARRCQSWVCVWKDFPIPQDIRLRIEQRLFSHDTVVPMKFRRFMG